MDRYDWDWTRRYGRDYGREFGTRRVRRYGGDFGAGSRPRGVWGAWPGPAYPVGYGSPGPRYPRGPMGGGWGRGYDRDLRGRGYPGVGGTRYDRGFTGGPFLPDLAYREHPELGLPRRGIGGRWAQRGYTSVFGDVDDKEIRSAVEQNLHQDGWVDASAIEVEVDQQVVTLTGEVSDYLEARYAWDDAWETMGVRGVVNNLTVRLDESTEKHQEVFPQSEAGVPAASRERPRRSRK